MRWEDERYVRIYTRDTAEWVALGWEAQCLFMAILRKVDRAGILTLGKTGVRGLAGLVGAPLDLVERALPVLLDDGCVKRTDTGLVLPNFIAAQDTPLSDKARQREKRERDRTRAMAEGDITQREAASRCVTEPHAESREVTPDHAGSLRAVPDHAEPSLAVPSEAALAGVSVGLPDGPTLHEMARRCAPANSYAAKMLAKLDGGEVLTKGQRDALKKIDGEEHGAERPPGQPDPSHETFARAYSAGMTDATGDPFTPPTDANAQQVFRAVLPVHAIGPDRQPLTGDALLAWIRASAAEWRRCVKPEDTRYTSGFVPAKWQTWLNAGRPGSAPPPARLLRPIVHDPIAEMARRRALPVEDE